MCHYKLCIRFHLFTQLFIREPDLRLGMDNCRHGSIRDVAFFSTIDWKALEERQLEPPFKPTIVSYQIHIKPRTVIKNLHQ